MNSLKLQRQQSNDMTGSLDNESIKWVITKEKLIGDYLDEILIKTNKTGGVVWIPKTSIHNLNSLAKDIIVKLHKEHYYACAKLQITNPIRLFLQEQHLVKGKNLIL